VSQVNLLPHELRERQAIRRTTSLVVAAGLAVLALIGIFYFFQVQRLSQTQSDLEAQQSRNAQLETEIASLQQFADLQAELAQKEALVGEIFVNEVSWSKALGDVSLVIPDASYLTNLTGQITPTIVGEVATEPTGGTPETTLIGNMTFAGVANQTETIATWITRLEEVQGWVNAWVNSAQEDVPFSRIYTFSNGLYLTQEAATARGQGVAP
jgi:Tfp pilus assembly protein PilN